jgi:hypothetical protein
MHQAEGVAALRRICAKMDGVIVFDAVHRTENGCLVRGSTPVVRDTLRDTCVTEGRQLYQ